MYRIIENSLKVPSPEEKNRACLAVACGFSRVICCLLTLSLFSLLTACSVVDQILVYKKRASERAIAAQHRETDRKSLKPGLLADNFDIRRRENITFPDNVRLAFAFDPVTDVDYVGSSEEQSVDTIEQALGAVTDRAFKRYFPYVTPMPPQSIESAEIVAAQRQADFLGFMRLVEWRQRRLVREAYCGTSEAEQLSPEQRKQIQQDQERIKNLTFAQPASPRGIRLPVKFKRCKLDFDEPRDAVTIQFWWLHLATGEIIDSGSIEGRSGWLSFANDEPSHLLQAPMEVLAASYLNGTSQTTSR